MADAEISGMSFEDAMKELESVVSRLERGEASLEESIALYERGAKLKAHCDERLSEAREKIAKITFGEGGKPVGTQAVEGL